MLLGRPTLLLLLLLPSLVGCTLLPYEAVPRPRVENPRPDLAEIVLVGFDGRPANEDPLRWQRSIQEQLLDIDGIDRIEAPLSEESPLLDPAPGRAFLALTVLHFDPYYPPEAIVEISYDIPAAPERTTNAILDLDRLGREQVVTAPAAARRQSFQLRVDADDSRLGHDLVRFAHAQLDGDRGSAPVDRVLRDSDRFVDFVSWLAVRETFARLSTPGKETR